MKSAASSPKTIDAYIADQPVAVRLLLQQVRAAIKKAAPEAEEAIRYNLPTFRLHGKNLLHFGAFKAHLGFYALPSGTSAFQKELSRYKSGKGSVQFPLDQPMPLRLIAKIAKFRAKEIKTGI
ncbi:iron chaperone [Oleiharenicola lentus]|uniref:iron chaperone n=1 Tax=Oleiharenicola lentus TaxID=2508720 RepID=UPI003F680589